jgi:hypothetical protein
LVIQSDILRNRKTISPTIEIALPMPTVHLVHVLWRTANGSLQTMAGNHAIASAMQRNKPGGRTVTGGCIDETGNDDYLYTTILMRETLFQSQTLQKASLNHGPFGIGIELNGRAAPGYATPIAVQPVNRISRTRRTGTGCW